MKKTIVFTGAQQLEVHTEPVPEAGDGELLVETTRTGRTPGTGPGQMLVGQGRFCI